MREHQRNCDDMAERNALKELLEHAEPRYFVRKNAFIRRYQRESQGTGCSVQKVIVCGNVARRSS
ncbi:hypothetical protein BDD26_0067 [Xenorhabdus cabanillasii]|uniref:Uncharacterized protein n=1 Tax=Xenorhabdus cabanillasii TaxID=351673 RepID=A0A3D9UFY8_9GAMM|nr:hypothetical protein Xcab_01692 [Xenorhabdus cabanillasii JM26]REF25575.1 hypothetical protein BDD26_0067 [Xenorhabdus cabanillasii]